MKKLVALFALVAILAAACGGETNTPALTGEFDSSSTEGGGEDEAANEATEEEAADDGESDDSETDDGESDDSETDEVRIVSLSPTATEMLFAIGAGDLVVAADSLSNYPADAPTTEIAAFEPNLEAVVEFDPTHVVISFDPGDLTSRLEQLGIVTINQPPASSLDDAYGQISDLGIATGQVDQAAAVVADLRTSIDEIVAAAPPQPDEPVRIYHEIDDTFFSSTSSTFIGQLYQLLGFENVADAADPDNEAFGFPQLSGEYLIEADPQLIVITDQVGYGVEDVAARAGWDTMAAVQNGGVLQVDADVASRWGPRVIDFLQLLSDALADQLVDA